MPFEAINNSIGLGRPVFILLVFALYLEMTKQYVQSLSILQYAMAIQKFFNKV